MASCQKIQKSLALLAAIAVLYPAIVAADASAPFVYAATDWPAINGDIITGLGAPTPGANAAFSSQVNFQPAAGLPAVVAKTANPQSGGVCPVGGNFGTNGSCWWTCGFGPDGFPCSGPKDVRTCQPGKWGLSYDDGPTNLTDSLLDRLKASNLKATFCLIGSQVIRFPVQAKRIYDEGHDICIHTWSHSPLTTLTNDEVIAEFKWTEKAIMTVTGVKPKYVRAPYGDQDNRIRAIADAMGYQMLLWLYDTADVKTFPGVVNPTPLQTIYDGMNSNLSASWPNGVIALEHAEKADIGIQIAKTFLDTASGKVQFLPVSSCLNDPKPYQSIAAPPAGNAANATNATAVKPTGSTASSTSWSSSVTTASAYALVLTASIYYIFL